MINLPTVTKRVRSQRVHVVRARYDAAQTTDENRRLWSAADGYDADSCNSLQVRTLLRNRGRYVYSNNPRAKGMIDMLANHTIGVGPRLQMQMGAGTQARKLNDRVESSFRAWAKEIKLAQKLRKIRISRAITGEIFSVLTSNPRLFHPVKLDVQLIEADQVTNPSWEFEREDVDGIFFDAYGNPDQYRVLKVHPGGSFYTLTKNEYNDVSARFCLHYFRADRPGQHRGIPEITPAVQLVEEQRRYRSASVAAAEAVADIAFTLESTAPADADTATGADALDGTPDVMDTLSLTRRMATVLPPGFKLSQTKAEQPTTTYPDFNRELLSEVARCLQIPLSLASLDARDANMSSSYVVNQPYEKAIDVERGDIESDVLEPIFDMWLTMAFDPMGSPMARRMPEDFPHVWYWPLIGEHADPQKVANSEDTRLKNNSTTLSAIYSRRGLDWETELEQRAKEKKRAKELAKEYGLTDTEMEAPPAGANGKPQSNGDQNEDVEETEDTGE